MWVAIAAIVAMASHASEAPETFRPLRVGEAVPAYKVRTLTGAPIRLGPGEPLTLINVWATWCGPCRQEFPELEKIHQAYRKRGLRVVAVSIDQGTESGVRQFVATQGATFLIGRDERGEVQRVLQTVGVPESFLVGSDGKLIWRKAGALRGGATDAREAINTALAGVHQAHSAR